MSKRSLSLVVTTYNRVEHFLGYVSDILHSDHPFKEIIVVDNGQSPAISKHIEKYRNSSVILIQPETNLGAVGRSRGILASTGDVVVTLDDDVRIDDFQSLLHLLKFLECHDRIGCVNFRIAYSDRHSLDLSDWCHPRDPSIFSDLLFETTYISEGACAFHGPLVRGLGAYDERLFIGQEGVDLAARIMDSGYAIYYLPTICTFHSVSMEGRVSGRQFYYNSRNIAWIAVKLYPWDLVLRTITREWTMLFMMSIIRRRFPSFVRGCVAGLLGLPSWLSERAPIRRSTAYRLKVLNQLKPSIWQRLLRVLQSKTFT